MEGGTAPHVHRGPGAAATPTHSRPLIKAHGLGCREPVLACLQAEVKVVVQGCEGLPPGGHVCGCGCALGSSQGRSKCLTPRREDIAARPCPWDLPALAVWPRTCCSTSLSLRCSLGPISAVRTDPETSRHGDISGWEGLLLLHEAARTPALSSPFSLRTAPLSVSSISYFVCCKGFTPRAKNSNCTRGCPVLSQFPNPDRGPLPSLRCSHRTLGAPSGVTSWGSFRGN